MRRRPRSRDDDDWEPTDLDENLAEPGQHSPKPDGERFSSGLRNGGRDSTSEPEAGGFDHSRAKPSAVTVLRVEHGKQRHFNLNLKHMLRGHDPTPFYLKPFDIVHVPEKTFNF